MKQLDEIKHYLETSLNMKLKWKTRKRSYVYARAVYFKLAREFTSCGFHTIAKSMNVNHATVIHAVNNVFPTVMLYDETLRNVYEDYKFENKYKNTNLKDNYLRLMKENVGLRAELKESLLDNASGKRFIDVVSRIPEDKRDYIYDKIEIMVSAFEK
jgi:hypothetical protein